MEPQPPEDQGEDELGDQERLYHCIAPLCSAMAWKTNAPASATHPRSHKGLDTR
jgi:hypothetical protein